MKITLLEWGSRGYSPAPSIRILRMWVRTGQIVPAPELVGRTLMVDEHAVRIPIDIQNVPDTISERARGILKAA